MSEWISGPNRLGVYWCYDPMNGKTEVVTVKSQLGMMSVNGVNVSVVPDRIMWLGPIEQPEPPNA